MAVAVVPVDILVMGELKLEEAAAVEQVMVMPVAAVAAGVSAYSDRAQAARMVMRSAITS
jgi:hypothetical protein